MKILAVVLALSGLTGAALGAVEPVVVIRCGRLIDGRADQAMTAVTVQIAGDRIAATGGHGDFNDLAADLALQVPNVVVDGPEAMRKAVREEIKHGADWIKLAATGGVMSAADDPRAQAFTDEELRAAVDEAHRHGRKVTVHAIGTGGIKPALRAGVDCIEHAVLIDPRATAMMKNGV